MIREIRTENYNYNFDTETGRFERWGKTIDDDPMMSPIGSEILDIEITTKCNGINGKLCSYCYKSNTPVGTNMSYKTFTDVIDTVNCNNQLTQIAFGLDSECTANPDIWKMCEYVRSKNIIPNGTVANISDETADKIASNFGACAISFHGDKDVCYDSVKKLTDRGLNQTNIHYVLSKETFKQAFEVASDMKKDERLAKMNAIVFLSLKKAGRAKNKGTALTQHEFNLLVDFSVAQKINFGFDSCGCHKFEKWIDIRPSFEHFRTYSEPCESSVFSSYCDVNGFFHPCSFCEHAEGMFSIDLKNVVDFMKEVWYNDKVVEFRNKLIEGGRRCPIFDV